MEFIKWREQDINTGSTETRISAKDPMRLRIIKPLLPNSGSRKATQMTRAIRAKMEKRKSKDKIGGFAEDDPGMTKAESESWLHENSSCEFTGKRGAT